MQREPSWFVTCRLEAGAQHWLRPSVRSALFMHWRRPFEFCTGHLSDCAARLQLPTVPLSCQHPTGRRPFLLLVTQR